MLGALWTSFKRLTPTAQWRNPVMMVTWLGALLTTVVAITDRDGFAAAIAAWLWLTVLFANFAESLAEGRGKAQAAGLRSAKKDTPAIKLDGTKRDSPGTTVPSSQLRKGDVVLVEAGKSIPGDGEIIEGGASVDESAITGESAPVVRAAGGDRTSVTGGTRVLSDWLIVRISANPGETFLDRMIAMVEGARRQRTPNEIALSILLSALTLVFLVAVVTLLPFSTYAVTSLGSGTAISLTVLVALLVCLIPTTIGGLLSAIGIAGMDRMIQANVVATSGRAIEAAGDVDVLLLDKTGTITLGNRQAFKFWTAPGVTLAQLTDAAQLASLPDETPEGRSVVVLAKKSGLRERNLNELNAGFMPFTAQTRMSGVDIKEMSGDRRIRKGAPDAIEAWLASQGSRTDPAIRTVIDNVASAGATPLVVAENDRTLGVIELRDIVKGGIKERFAQLRRMGIKTVMITGDNRLTAAAIAAEAGVDDFLAEATPEAKLKLIREQQEGGRLVAMCGDGTNDAPALAQADVAVAM
ncbi:MAG: potassium-transporting ATPase subunit KdpB, partial [Burkholderiaceae bacterium]|nr:potassium-transporting ATPase subunit KdpB [Burkholderiaceae bacterium]